MNMLFDVGHPAHVHFLRIVARRLQNDGWSCLFTVRNKPIVIQLLEHYGFSYNICGSHRKSLSGKIAGLITITWKLLKISRQFKPDFFMNASPSAAFVAWLLGKPHIALEDTFNMEQVCLYLPFTSLVLTGDYPHPSLGKKELRYPGYHELAYLHPNVYTPDASILDSLGVKKDEKYSIIRFVSWNASHDIGKKGIPNEYKTRIVKKLSAHMRVFVSAEGEIPEDIREYKLYTPPHRIHDVLAHASLFFGEGATMAEEASMLGVPSIFVTSAPDQGLYQELVNRQLLHLFSCSFTDLERAIDLALMIAQSETYSQLQKQRRDLMLENRIDVSNFLHWLINKLVEDGSVEIGEIDFNMFK